MKKHRPSPHIREFYPYFVNKRQIHRNGKKASWLAFDWAGCTGMEEQLQTGGNVLGLRQHGGPPSSVTM